MNFALSGLRCCAGRLWLGPHCLYGARGLGCDVQRNARAVADD